ncbi:phage tail protein [Ancylobacter polymorphus]|uniref:Tail fiber protein n=1 Tax=Ancylobacter polymorphus TaxID=223390 RepID=A0A9E7A0T3_9HYPH|nr:tail fiber protein [Ancylobacter polymorphus]UOK70408.1 tail fiber protein [Ancylobacter polymorphus]
MVEYYVGEIRAFAGNRVPYGWAWCDGKKITIQDHEALFSLLGTTWGGDGVKQFALPDLRGRLPVGAGQGIGLVTRTLGEQGGEEQVGLTAEQLPPHKHPLMATIDAADTNEPGVGVIFATAASPDAAANRAGLPYIHDMSGVTVVKNILAPGTVRILSHSHSAKHSNLMPSLSINYIIALNGIYPSP